MTKPNKGIGEGIRIKFWSDVAHQKGLRCGSCIEYFCDEYDGDQCENDNDITARKCKAFRSWRSILKLKLNFWR